MDALDIDLGGVFAYVDPGGAGATAKIVRSDNSGGDSQLGNLVARAMQTQEGVEAEAGGLVGQGEDGRLVDEPAIPVQAPLDLHGLEEPRVGAGGVDDLGEVAALEDLGAGAIEPRRHQPQGQPRLGDVADRQVLTQQRLEPLALQHPAQAG